MKKLSSTFPNMLLSLTLISVLAAGLLSFVYNSTYGAIQRSKSEALKTAIALVTPKYDNDPIADMSKVALDGDSIAVYPVKKGGVLIGTAIRSVTHKGFGGDITILFGLDPKGSIINYSVLEMQETPGLGTKMQEWFRTDKGQQSVINRSLADGPLKVTKDQGSVDAITAATISSRAFLDAANRAYDAQKSYLESQK